MDQANNVDSELKISKYPTQILWYKVVLLGLFHIGAVYGFYLLITVCMWKTILWNSALVFLGTQGAAAGAHRLWSHNSFKAKLPLRILLMLFQSMALHMPIYTFVRDHRVHHKYTDTYADPYTSRRGFFFSHLGWLMVKKHPEVLAKGQNIDISDVMADPVVRFQKRYYFHLVLVMCFIFPMVVPWYFWGEDLWTAYNACSLFVFVYNLNLALFVNSIAHRWGTKPYDKTINPADNRLMTVLAFGEGWHNYHHVFPWDYRSAELGVYEPNLTALFIDFFALIGWAYDLKTATVDHIKKRADRTGDGSIVFNHQAPWSRAMQTASY